MKTLLFRVAYILKMIGATHIPDAGKSSLDFKMQYAMLFTKGLRFKSYPLLKFQMLQAV